MRGGWGREEWAEERSKEKNELSELAHCYAFRDGLDRIDFADRLGNEAIPSTLTGVRQHPLYTLRRFVGKKSMLYMAPSTKKGEEDNQANGGEWRNELDKRLRANVCGYVRGEPVFLQVLVHPLRTAWQWKRKYLREVGLFPSLSLLLYQYYQNPFLTTFLTITL